jgi:hypothetical protein
VERFQTTSKIYKKDTCPKQYVQFSNLNISNVQQQFLMAAYTILVQDLIQSTPENVDVTPVPYNPLQTFELQILTAYQKLQRSTRRRDRIMTLTHAYYLGEILENIPNRSHRSYLNSQITKYYSLASRCTYLLFEKTGIQQIYRTRSITLRLIYQMPQSDFLALTRD